MVDPIGQFKGIEKPHTAQKSTEPKGMPKTYDMPTIPILGKNINDCTTEKGVQGQDLSKKHIVAGEYSPKGANLPLPEKTK